MRLNSTVDVMMRLPHDDEIHPTTRVFRPINFVTVYLRRYIPIPAIRFSSLEYQLDQTHVEFGTCGQ